MKKTGYIALCCMVGAGAFIVPIPPPLQAYSPRSPRFNSRSAVGGESDEVSVFDAGEAAVSWDDYKKQKPNEYKVCVMLALAFC